MVVVVVDETHEEKEKALTAGFGNYISQIREIQFDVGITKKEKPMGDFLAQNSLGLGIRLPESWFHVYCPWLGCSVVRQENTQKLPHPWQRHHRRKFKGYMRKRGR